MGDSATRACPFALHPDQQRMAVRLRPIQRQACVAEAAICAKLYLGELAEIMHSPSKFARIGSCSGAAGITSIDNNGFAGRLVIVTLRSSLTGSGYSGTDVQRVFIFEPLRELL